MSKPLPAAVVTRFLQIRDTSSRNNQECAVRERGKVHTGYCGAVVCKCRLKMSTVTASSADAATRVDVSLARALGLCLKTSHIEAGQSVGELDPREYVNQACAEKCDQKSTVLVHVV